VDAPHQGQVGFGISEADRRSDRCAPAQHGGHDGGCARAFVLDVAIVVVLVLALFA
jgi:hypothetical protein